jgi:CheY-like chemotaxis protein
MITAQRETALLPSVLSDSASGSPINRATRVLIVDDSPRFRLELRGLLELEDIQVVGEAGNGWEALSLTETLNPDLILMDQNMPALSGIDATRRIKQAKPDRRVVFVAAEEAWRQEAMRAGAEGYFVKGDGFDQLLRVILQPGLGGALQYQRESHKQRRSVLRRVGITLAGMAVFALFLIVFPLPPQWFPAIALLFATFSFVLYLFGGD